MFHWRQFPSCLLFNLRVVNHLMCNSLLHCLARTCYNMKVVCGSLSAHIKPRMLCLVEVHFRSNENCANCHHSEAGRRHGSAICSFAVVAAAIIADSGEFCCSSLVIGRRRLFGKATLGLAVSSRLRTHLIYIRELLWELLGKLLIGELRVLVLVLIVPLGRSCSN